SLVQGGLPKGALNFITGAAREVGALLTESPVVRAISFTGSTAAGEQIHRAAPLTARTQMELGGKNPLLVMEDADLDKAVDLAIRGGLSLTGQACTGTSRLLVHAAVKQDFTDRLVAKVKALRVGSGMDPKNELGPIATQKQLETVLRYVGIGKQEARHLYGGERLRGNDYDHGYFLTPAIFTDVSQAMRIAREE